MRVIIAGGSGFIGKPLACKLFEEGYEVVILSRRPDKLRGFPEGIKIVRWDGKSSNGWGGLMGKDCGIINLAGENIGAGRWNEKRKMQILDSRLNAGTAIVEACREAKDKPKVIVQASAIGYYGSSGSEIINENSKQGTGFLAGVAGQWEKSTSRLDEMGIRRVIIRLGIVFGKGGGALPRMLMPFYFYMGGRLGDGKQWLSWIHLADVIGAICFLLQDDKSGGIFNLTAPNPITNDEFVKIVKKLLKKPAFMHVPGFILKIVFGEMASLLLDGQRVVPENLLRIGYNFKFSTADFALRDLLLPNEQQER